MQTSPREPAPTGITRVMQTSPKKVSQTGGTQTSPQPSPKRPTSTGETQTTPSQSNVQDQGTQGQLDCNHTREDLPTHNSAPNTGKGKNMKKFTYEVPPQPGTSAGGFVVPRTDFNSRNLGTGRPTIQCRACQEYSHLGEENVHTTTFAPHATITTMQHTCAGYPSRHPNRVLPFVYIVAVQSTAHHNVTIGHGITGNNHVLCWKPSGTRNFNVPTAKFQEMQDSSHQMLKEGPANCIPTGHTAKFQEALALTNRIIMITRNFLGETRTTTVTREGYSYRFWLTLH